MNTPQERDDRRRICLQRERGRSPGRGRSRRPDHYLLMGSDAGGERAASIYSLVETAKLNGPDPQAYLREVLTRIADYPINHIDELLPWNIANIVLRDEEQRQLARAIAA